MICLTRPRLAEYVSTTTKEGLHVLAVTPMKRTGRNKRAS